MKTGQFNIERMKFGIADVVCTESEVKEAEHHKIIYSGGNSHEIGAVIILVKEIARTLKCF